MQHSSSGGNRDSRSSHSRPRGDSRGGSRGGDRNRSRSDRPGEPRRDSHRNDGPDEFRPSDEAPRGRGKRESSRPAPQPTALQKFIKFITFGLVDPAVKQKPAAKGPREARPPREAREPGTPGADGVKRERRAPLFVEPTTPRLYVGNLSYEVTGADLESLFSAHGTVTEASVVTQAGSDRSKGFAFVEMGSIEEAKAAAAALNDKDFQGRQMLVTGAKSEGRAEESTRPPRSRDGGERSERGPRPGGRGERGGERKERGGRPPRGDFDEIDKPSRQVRPLVIETVTSPNLDVANINADASEVDIVDLFAGIGTIQLREETGPGKDERTKNLRINLSDTTEAQKAVELLHGKCFMGHEIQVTGVKTETEA